MSFQIWKDVEARLVGKQIPLTTQDWIRQGYLAGLTRAAEIARESDEKWSSESAERKTTDSRQSDMYFGRACGAGDIATAIEVERDREGAK